MTGLQTPSSTATSAGGWLAGARRILAAGIGAAAGRAVLGVGRDLASRGLPAAEQLERTNFRGGTVSLVGGHALVAGAVVGAVVGADQPRSAAAAAVAGLGAGLVGGIDDVVGARADQPPAKGFAGHLAALRQGRVTTGVIKIAGIGASALAAAALMPAGRRRRCIGDVLLDAGLIAGTANLVNLLDLRPGRALKVGMLCGGPIGLGGGPGSGIAAGAVGAAVGVLPEDLGERVMLGDAGANALGALLGTSLVAGRGRLARVGLLAGVIGLTAASERISFSKVIAETPVLRQLDEFGRRPA